MKISGVYKITNLVSGKSYVGSSKDIYGRWKRHRYDLRKGKHPNNHLQNAWNLYGDETFTIDIVEECSLDRDILLRREQYYLDVLTPEYNFCHIAGSTLGAKRSEETKAKMSMSNKGQRAWNKGMKLSDEWKRKIGESQVGKAISDEQKKHQSEIMKGRISPNKGKKMSEEQKEKLRLSHLGKVSPNKGKKMSEEQKVKISKANTGRRWTDEQKLYLREVLSAKKQASTPTGEKK